MGSQFPPNERGASCLSRARIGQDFFDFIHHGTWRLHWDLSPECTYAELKREVGKRTETVVNVVKEALGRWTTNDTDIDFTLVAPRC